MITQCRICNSSALTKVLFLGDVPLAGNFLTSHLQRYVTHQLDLFYCSECRIFQVGNLVDPSELFGDYHYSSSQVTALLDHFSDYAHLVKSQYSNYKSARILEIGCNDLPFLRWFADDPSYFCIGIDPSFPPIKLPNLRRIQSFFTLDVAQDLLSNYGRFDFVYAANVFAHIPNLIDTLQGLRLLTSDTGRIVIEVHDCLAMLSSSQFDTIYHEHIYYHSLSSLAYISRKCSLSIVQVEQIPTHGGSLRVTLSRAAHSEAQSIVARQTDLERHAIPLLASTFSDSVYSNLALFKQIVSDLDQHFSISCYGIAGRAIIFLHLLSLSPSFFKNFYDDSPQRIGKYVPGFQPQIQPGQLISLLSSRDILLITAWNYVDAIVDTLTLRGYRGLAFVLLPSPKLVFIPPSYQDKTSIEFLCNVLKISL